MAGKRRPQGRQIAVLQIPIARALRTNPQEHGPWFSLVRARSRERPTEGRLLPEGRGLSASVKFLLVKRRLHFHRRLSACLTVGGARLRLRKHARLRLRKHARLSKENLMLECCPPASASLVHNLHTYSYEGETQKALRKNPSHHLRVTRH